MLYASNFIMQHSSIIYRISSISRPTLAPMERYRSRKRNPIESPLGVVSNKHVFQVASGPGQTYQDIFRNNGFGPQFGHGHARSLVHGAARVICWYH